MFDFLLGILVFIPSFLSELFNTFLWIWFGPRFKSELRLEGKVAVVTGGNCGIGKETAIELARRGAKVILACRNQVRAFEAIKNIKSQIPSANVVFARLDLASLKSVRDFVFNLKESKIDLLINNAGVGVPKGLTEDGFEIHFGINHLGHFLLTLLLLPKLKQSAHARVINLTSILYCFGSIDFENYSKEITFLPSRGYCNSKLANVLFTCELARRLEGTNITTYAAHPGYCDTEVFKHTKSGGIFERSLYWLVLDPLLRTIARSAKWGCQTTLYCALDSSAEKESGLYYESCRVAKWVAPCGKNMQVARRLWELSAKLVGIRENYMVAAMQTQ